MAGRSWMDICVSIGVCRPANLGRNMSYDENLTSSLVDWPIRRVLEKWHNVTGINRTLEHSSTFEHSLYQIPVVWPTEVVARVITIVVIMALTLLGNTALIGGICCYASLRRKRVSIFLVNLAVADLMVCAVTMTTEIFFVAFGEWILGAVACKLVVYGQIVTLSSTTFLLTAMSIDRYQVLVEPLKSLRGQPKVRRKVQVAWLLAFIFATPQLFIFVQTEETVAERTVRACKSQGYTEEWQRKVYFSFLTAYILVIPMVIMSYCYLNIIRTVWMRAGGRDVDQPRVHFVTSRREARRSAAGVESTVSSPLRDHKGSVRARQSAVSFGLPHRVVSSSKRNVIKMTLSVILGFLVCWTPYFVVSLVRIFSHYRIQLTHVLSVCEIMAMAHSALNPLLYGIFSTRTLRLAAVHFFCRFTRRRIHNVSPDSLSLSEFNQTPLVWQRGNNAVNRLSYRTFVSSGKSALGNSAREIYSSADQRRGTQCIDEQDLCGGTQSTSKEVPVVEETPRRRTNSREHSSVSEVDSSRHREPSWYRPQSTYDGYGAYVSVQAPDRRQYLVRQNYSASQRADLASSKDSRTQEQTFL